MVDKPTTPAGSAALPPFELTSTDVFELAAEVSRECERIGDEFGQDAISGIVPRVLKSLQLLEECVERVELLTADLVEAQLDRDRALDEKQNEIEYRRKIEDEFRLALEDQTRESEKLKHELTQLIGVNETLQTQNKASRFKRQPSLGLSSAYKELSEEVESQREELRSRKLEIARQASEIEALVQQVRRITAINQALQKSQGAAQERAKKLAEEKASLSAKIAEREKAEKDKLAKDDQADGGHAARSQDDDGKESDRSKELRYTREDMHHVLEERLQYKMKVDELEEEMQLLRESMNVTSDLNPPTESRQRPVLQKTESRLQSLFKKMDASTDDSESAANVYF